VGEVTERKSEARHFREGHASYRVDNHVQPKVKIIEIDCHEVRRELVNYMEEDITPGLRTRIDAHLRGCHHCTAVYDGVRNVVKLLGNGQIMDLPKGLSQRLYKRLSRVQ
jgi:Putative zinc-finger